jgi:hypothetical protein
MGKAPVRDLLWLPVMVLRQERVPDWAKDWGAVRGWGVAKD